MIEKVVVHVIHQDNMRTDLYVFMWVYIMFVGVNDFKCVVLKSQARPKYHRCVCVVMNRFEGRPYGITALVRISKSAAPR